MLKLFPYNSGIIEEGFRYLGFFINPNGYGPKDWEWLLKCMSHKISSWYFHYLSLGIRLVLIDSMLQGIPMYSMYLLSLLSWILSRIGSKLFHFLWLGSLEVGKFH